MSKHLDDRRLGWWATTAALELLFVCLFWPLAREFMANVFLRFTAVWFFGAAFALGVLALAIQAKDLFLGSGEIRPLTDN